ncbi:unnamed protein product [Ixodes persulcatus]
MECTVRSMAEAQVSEEQAVVPEGRVEKGRCQCGGWLPASDGAGRFRTQPHALVVVESTEENQGTLPRPILPLTLRWTATDAIRATEVDDEKIALELQQQLQREAAIHASLQEEDERMALELQRRELPKKLDRIERRRKDDALPAALRRLSLGEESGGADAETVERDSDFSDFCLQPPPGLEGEELRRFQEEQDAELARLLQEQETKRRGQSAKDRQIAMEAQDRELAKMLQDQEKARLRRARERARQKAMLQQQQQQDMDTIEELNPANRHTVAPNSTAGTADLHYLESLTQSSTHRDSIILYFKPSFTAVMTNRSSVLCSTLGRRKHGGNHKFRERLITWECYSTHNKLLVGRVTTSTCRICPGGSTSSPALSNVCYDDLDDGEGAVPPYMPIQGQRRSTSFEKGKKAKKTKDTCKTQ